MTNLEILEKALQVGPIVGRDDVSLEESSKKLSESIGRLYKMNAHILSPVIDSVLLRMGAFYSSKGSKTTKN